MYLPHSCVHRLHRLDSGVSLLKAAQAEALDLGIVLELDLDLDSIRSERLGQVPLSAAGLVPLLIWAFSLTGCLCVWINHAIIQRLSFWNSQIGCPYCLSFDPDLEVTLELPCRCIPYHGWLNV